MEELQELAALQATISMLSRHSFSSQHALNDLFLAKFLIFSVELCSDADDMSRKCSFLASRLQQISSSSALLQDLFDQQKKDICSKSKVTRRNRTSAHCTANENVSITLTDLERANSTLEDFCRSYFMFHEMSGQDVRDVFKYFPVLAFVESFIYQIDEQRERLLLLSNSEHVHVGKLFFWICEKIILTFCRSFSWYLCLSLSLCVHACSCVHVLVYVFSGASRFQVLCAGVTSEAFVKAEKKCFKSLHEILASRNLWTIRIEEELKNGLEYWNLEHSLCMSLLVEEEISLSDVMRAIKLKSFDYRVLNILLYELTDQPVNETHMDFLSASELLVEISDDLFDYEEDVLHNSFNILQMFLRIYGSSEAPYMLAQMIAEAEENYRELLGNLEPSLALKYQNRCQQAVAEGGGSCSSSHPMGSWTIPPLILNEQMYRERIKREAK